MRDPGDDDVGLSAECCPDCGRQLRADGLCDFGCNDQRDYDQEED